MGTKIPTTDVTRVDTSTPILNANFKALSDAFDDTLFSDSAKLNGTMDADSNRIINLPTAALSHEAVPYGQMLAERLPGRDGIDGAKGDPGGNVMAISLFTDIASLTIPAGTDRLATSAWGTGAYRPKGWGAATYARFAAPLTSLPAEGQGYWWSYDATGTQAWYLATEGEAYLDMFGAPKVAASQSASNLDCWPYWNVADIWSRWTWGGLSGGYYFGGRDVHFRPGYYYMGSRAIEAKRASYALRGPNTGLGGVRSVILEWDARSTAVIISAYNTLGKGIDPSPASAGAGFRLIGLSLRCRGTPDHSLIDNPAILMRARAIISDCFIENFDGDGIRIYASSGAGGAGEGNANNWSVVNTRVQQCRSGLSCQGADTNAGYCVLFDASSNYKWGVEDLSFLGNTYVGGHCDANALRGSARRDLVLATTYHLGYFWVVVADPTGQAEGVNAALASTTEPGTNPLVWEAFQKSTAANYFQPQWVSGTQYETGGAIRTLGQNAPSVFIGQYTESGQPPVQGQGLASFNAGIIASGATKITDYNGGVGNAHNFTKPVRVRPISVEGKIHDVEMGGETNLGTILSWTNSDQSPNKWRLYHGYAGTFGPDITLNYANGPTPFTITGPLTTRTFGRDTTQPYYFAPINFVFGGVSGRVWAAGSAKPTTGNHAIGEIVWNTAPAPGGFAGFICTTAGTPGTWKGFGTIEA